MTTSTHSYHGYELALHHESDDRYRVTIFDPKGNRIASTGTHLERQGALTEASRRVNQILAQRRTTSGSGTDVNQNSSETGRSNRMSAFGTKRT
jgi:hypothetical protein